MSAEAGELKPCPFCGGEPKLYATTPSASFFEVGCGRCFCGINAAFSREEAIKYWNRRATSSSGTAQESGAMVVALTKAIQWTPINELEPAMGERLFVTFNDGKSIWASDIHWDSIADSNPYITHGIRLPDPAPLQHRVLTSTASAAEEARKGIEVEVRQAIWSKLHDGELNWPNIKAAILGAGEGEP